jgi:hypothetical protein
MSCYAQKRMLWNMEPYSNYPWKEITKTNSNLIEIPDGVVIWSRRFSQFIELICVKKERRGKGLGVNLLTKKQRLSTWASIEIKGQHSTLRLRAHEWTINSGHSF